MSNDTHPLSAPGTSDLSDKAEPGPLDTGPLDAADLPIEVSAELEQDEMDEPSLLMQDAHSQPIGTLDVHTVPAAPGSASEPPQPQPPTEAPAPATEQAATRQP